MTQVEPDRGSAIELMLVVADRVAAPVRREMVERVPIAQRERGVRARVGTEPHAATHDFVPILVVERVQAVARKARHSDAVSGARAACGERRVERAAAVRPDAPGHGSARRPPTVPGEDLHDAGHGIGSVQYAGRSPHDLDAFHVVGGEIGKSYAPPGAFCGTPSIKTLT